MFTKNQLNFLVRVQATDDYHCSEFVNALKYYHKNPVDAFISEVDISAEEFNELMETLSHVSQETIWELQMGLNYFNEFLCSKSYNSDTENTLRTKGQ